MIATNWNILKQFASFNSPATHSYFTRISTKNQIKFTKLIQIFSSSSWWDLKYSAIKKWLAPTRLPWLPSLGLPLLHFKV